MNSRRWFVSVSTVATLVGCEPELPNAIKGLGPRDSGASDADASDAEQSHDDASRPLDPEPYLIGVVSGDYNVVSIALLDADGSVLDDDFVNSGSAPAGLVTALSGDVTLPTRSGDPTKLTILDRFRTDVLTRIDSETGEVLGQVKTHTPNAQDDDATYSSNPQDYVYFGAHDAWVSRFAPNLRVQANHPDRGLDLLHIDPTDFTRGERISLWHLNGEARRPSAGTTPTEMVTVYARPSGMVRLGDRLVVGIASLSLSFDVAGDGMVALVDPSARTAEGLTLPGLQNCPSVAPVAGDPTRVVVSCQGFLRGVPRDTAGLAIVKLEDDELSIEHIWRAADHVEAPLAVGGVVSLGGTEVVATAYGSAAVRGQGGVELMPATGDVMYVVDIATGEHMRVFEAAGRYKIGSGSYNARRRLLLVPDASTDSRGRPSAGVRTFERKDDGSFEPRQVIRLHDILPPLQVTAL